MGVYNWLIHDRKSAFKWWQKAIREGEKLGARPQLARTYAEIAARTLAVRDEFSQARLRAAETYLEKAKAMFSEMGLHRDLEDLNSAVSRPPPDRNGHSKK
jgi:transposase-like protein